MRNAFPLVLAVFILSVSNLSCAETGSDIPVIDGGGDEEPVFGGKLKDGPYKVGCAVNLNRLESNDEYMQTVAGEFSSITAENAMKMWYMWKRKDFIDYADADRIVAFAKKNGIRVHGHTLIWYKVNDCWVKDFQSNDKEEWKKLMKDYITAVMTHFKGEVTSWDVVNEAISSDGSGDGFRGDDDIWYRNIGPEYVELAFRYAREADHDALLFYNDYGFEWSPSKRDRIFTMLESLKEKGLVDGVGLQTHTTINVNPKYIKVSIDRARELGLLVHVSEMDVDIFPNGEGHGLVTYEMLEKQKNMYRSVAGYLKELPEGTAYGMTTWGVADNDTERYTYSMLFDENFFPKPAYDGIAETFAE